MDIQILMPALSPTMEEGKLAKWLVKEGDEVHSGDVLAEIETDKATMEFEAVDEGKIGKILVPEGTEGVKVNQPIAVLLSEDDGQGNGHDIPSAMQSIRDAVAAEAVGVKPSPASAAPVSASATRATVVAQARSPSSMSEDRWHAQHCVFASPLAKRLAAQAGIDIAAVKGSGPRGRVVKTDIEEARHMGGVAARPLQKIEGSAPHAAGQKTEALGVMPLPDARLFYRPDSYQEVPHDSIRKAIARRLTSAKVLIPHYYLTIDCRIDALLAARARLNGQAPKGDGAYKLSVNDFIVKASALALMRVPEVNASWTDTAILRHRHADVGVAVALDFGLITPIVFAAEAKGLVAISAEIKSLAERARAKRLKPQEYEGGSFAVSNLGMFGIKDFTAVINPPQAAILAVGASESRAIVRNDKIEIADIMTVTLSCDHRVIDGATGARFLQAFRLFIEDPATMLL
ncbi:MAG TPA: pyruvate dehydrogenase complex dihydrolipoamide acetyltransferase [Rhizomicrobium sp.]|nr:pyruvate dehydrogenase complex dihydrolipoamide acetyltransferase [Rhizomicrobium sp.]